MQLDFFLSIVFEIDVEYGPIIIKFFLRRFEQSWKEKKVRPKNGQIHFCFKCKTDYKNQAK